MRDLVGRHAGIVRRVVPAVTSERDAPIFAFAAELCDTSALGAGRCVPTAAGGGRTREEALAACLGEAAERYAAAMADPRALEWEGAEGDLGPGDVAPFSAEQRARPDFPFRGTGPLARVRGADGRRAPAFAVFLPYTPRSEGESIPGPSLSTGLAAGPTVEAARETALLEVIERDALANAWASGEPAPRAGDVVDLTGDLGVPAAAALLEGDVISVGAAAARTFEAAAAKARLEAALGQIYVRALVRRAPPPEEVVSFADHARYYTDRPSARGALGFFRDGARRDPAPGPVDPLEAVERAGFRPWWRDLTTPDLRRAGVHVVRVLVPGLTPLHSWEAWPFLGAPRLRARNLFPHPLP